MMRDETIITALHIAGESLRGRFPIKKMIENLKTAMAILMVLTAGCGPKVEPPSPELPETEKVITTQERLLLAADLMDKGLVGEAADHYVAVLEDTPDDFEANLNLGIALLTMEEAGFQNERDYAKARSHFLRAVELGGHDPRPHLYLGKIEFENKAYGAAIEHLTTATSLDPGEESAHEMLGIALIEVGSREAGAKELGRALEINPRNPAANLALGEVYEMDDRNSLAMGHLERALAVNPNLDMATYLLERIYYEEGLYNKAEEMCREFLKYHRDDIQSLEILGWIYKIQGRTTEMVEVYEKLARIEPGNTSYWSPAIQHHMESNEYGIARQLLEESLRHNPYYAYGNVRYAQVLMHYAEAAAKSGKREEAIALFSLARDHLGRAKVDERYSSAAAQLITQMENRLRELTRP